MKFILLASILVITACSSKILQKDNNQSMSELLRSGKDIKIENFTFEEEVDFTSIMDLKPSGPHIEVGRILSNLYFENCTFRKGFKAYNIDNSGNERLIYFGENVSFINCKFEGEVNFKAATFAGMMHFNDSVFRKKAIFQDILCMQRANFNQAFWQEEAFFQNARFYHKANFMEIIAHGNLMFQSANFRDDCNFSMSDCKKYVDFSLVRFEGPAIFNYIKWNDRAVFSNAVCMVDFAMIDPSVGDVSLSNMDARGKVTLSGDGTKNIKDKPIKAGK